MSLKWWQLEGTGGKIKAVAHRFRGTSAIQMPTISTILYTPIQGSTLADHNVHITLTTVVLHTQRNK